jgi:A/G-specific adenine glycosylase
MQVKHAYSHFKITLHPFFCRHLKGRIQKIGVMDYRWVTSSELSEYAFPRADRRVIETLQGIADNRYSPASVLRDRSL